MSMNGKFVAITDAECQRLTANPDALESFLYPANGDYDSVGEELIDIDKTWHAIHFLLTGSQYEGEAPARNVIMGGEDLGPDIGYGPARLMHADQVKSVAAYLGALPGNYLESKFDLELLAGNDIYPSIWDDPDEDREELFAYVSESFEQVKAFYSAAAENGHCVILYVN